MCVCDFRSSAPDLRVRPVVPQTANDTCRSPRTGTRLANDENPDTFCDAIVTPMPGELTITILHQLAGSGLCLDDRCLSWKMCSPKAFSAIEQQACPLRQLLAAGNELKFLSAQHSAVRIREEILHTKYLNDR